MDSVLQDRNYFGDQTDLEIRENRNLSICPYLQSVYIDSV